MSDPTFLRLENYDIVDLTVSEVRSLLPELPDHEALDALTSELDKAQGDIHSGQSDTRYIIIRVSP